MRVVVLMLTLGACRIGFDARSDLGDAGGLGPLVAVTVSKTGAGTGSVAGIACSGCTTMIAAGTNLNLTAIADSGSWFRGWTSQCAGRHECTFVVPSEPITITADFTPEPNRIFVSSTPHDGNFGTLAVGNAECQSFAAQAGLSGTYVILLATAVDGWANQLMGARGWILPNGEPFADRYYEIGGQTTRAALRLTASGADVGSVGVWALSYVASESCSDWTSSAANGRAIGTDRGVNYQSGGGATSCANPQHYFCAQNDRVQPVDPIADVGRIAFTTAAAWSDASGLSAADALCASEASSGGHTGSFRALLATPGASALSRFDLDGPPWVRTDGMRFLPTGSDWATATRFDVAPLRTATNDSLLYGGIVTGASTFATPGTLASTCSDWTGTGEVAVTAWTWDLPITDLLRQNCPTGSRLLCLEE